MATETITLRLVAQDLMSGNVSKAIAGLDRLARRGGLVGSVMQGVGQSFGQMLNPAAMVANGIGAITDAAGQAITAASDLAEQSSKVGEVFDEQADQVRDWARSLDSSFGITERQALTTAGTLGNLFDAMGIGTSQTVEMSTALTELAGDLASFNNADIKEVLVALQSGIVGETEPMRRFGVDLSAAAVNAKALALGLKATASELTQNDKVRARYALIMEKTATAQGDAARTADTLAGRQRQMNAQVGNLQTKIGTLLIGPASGFLGFLNGVVDVIDGPDGVERRLQDAADAVHRLNVEAKAAAGPGISPIAKLNADMAKWADTLNSQEFNFDPQTFDWLEKLGPDTLRNFGPASADVLARVAAIARSVQDTGGDFEDFGRIIREVIGEEVPGSFNILTSAWTGVSAAAEETGATIYSGLVKPVKKAMADMFATASDAKAPWKAAMKALAQAAKDPFSDEKFAGWMAKKAKKLVDNARREYREGGPDMRRQARALAYVMTNPVLVALAKTEEEIKALANARLVIDIIQKKTGTGTMGSDEKVAGRASGGPVSAGQTYVVGENGPEVLRMGAGQSGYVIPNHALRNGGGSIVVNVTHIGNISEAEGDRLAAVIEKPLRRRMARAGA